MLCVAIFVVVGVFVASFSFKCGIWNMVALILIKLTMQLMPAVLCSLPPSPCSFNRLQTPTSYLHRLRNNVINIYASYSRRVKLSPDKHLTFDCATALEHTHTAHTHTETATGQHLCVLRLSQGK